MSYDLRCFDLAAVFLGDAGPFTEDDASRLAEALQRTAEDFLEERRLVAENRVIETHINVTANQKMVRIEFGRPLAWFDLDRAHAMQLGITLMRAAGAEIKRP
jgi:hypothetical protein